MPPQTRPNSSGMGYERKRVVSDTAAASSSSSFVRHHAFAPMHDQQRSASPPASTYFPLLSGDSGARLRPTADAESHFAYSTTLRRHGADGSPISPIDIAHAVNAEASSLWTRAVSVVTGQPLETNLENGRMTPPPMQEQLRDTMSARFAHCSIEETVAHFRTSVTSGLLRSDIPNLLSDHGYNEFSVSTPEHVLIKFAKTIYESPLILLLCASATVSALMGNVDDAVSIAVAVLIVLTVGFVQEQRSEQSLQALNKLVPHHCHVLREGQTFHILANELVPGDIVTFATGDRIPADIRVVAAVDLEVDESSLTGETEARKKGVETCVYGGGGGRGVREPVALAERASVAHMGSLVRNGRGTGIVIATGTATELGVVFSMVQDVEEKRTPLQLSMDELAKKLSIISFGIIAVICIIGVLQHRSWLDMFTIGVSLAVAAIPEGLPIVTTVTLALGVLRMAKRKAIVKRLHSVESLGSVSVICSDKTGTLTKNEQTVIEAYAVDEVEHLDPPPAALSAAIRKTLEIGAICNNASIVRNEEGIFVGQSTDVALLNILHACGLPDQRTTFKRLSERPFNSEQKYMSVSGVHPDGTGLSAIGGAQREMYYIKGAIETVLERCKFYYVTDESTPALDATTRRVILGKAQGIAARGLRVVAMAFGGGERENWNLVFAGFQAMHDPPRKEVAASIELLQKGGVQVVMITGDAEETALAIARQLGLRVGGHGHGRGQSVSGMAGSDLGSSALAGGAAGNSWVLTGKAIDQMSKAQLKERVGTVSVFARTTPRHKMAIVEAYQSRGAIVAMTGDGVNDAPALKMADIGVSMGKSGTDVAKEAADVILVDDNFSTILPAVEEGKSIFHNIQNFLSFQLSTAAAALTLITLSTMLGLNNPLNAMQILFINILMDGPPSQSLGVDPVDPAVMRRPPRKKDAPIITRRLLYRVLFSASIIVVGTLFVYIFALEDEKMSRREQTMTFTAFVCLDLVSAVQNRGIGCGLFQNKMLVTTVSISAITQLALVYVPFMQAIFQTAALDFGDLGVILALAGTSFALHEGRRRYERKLNLDLTWNEAGEMV
ncbi:Ca-transporting ATPase [Mycena albidolilacea]|uniref:Ca-transporting ATPase n=1 Tax=Mycena albidolilacea TaxID=1033008 RepID=A0AAD7ETQ5_9AGAR|nr:Ca-transporting ATPase [Mycena albidolilacea]